MQATVYNLAGEELDTVELDDTIFGITPNMAVVHQAVVRQQANARQGTHETKTRAFVRGGGKKPWRQKGTGRARQGSTRSPQWRHGGVVFGPHQRSYVQDMPRKMRRLAFRSVLSAKAADGQIVVVDNFDEIEPRTKAIVDVLAKLNVTGSALIMTAARDENLEKASSNLPKVDTIGAHMLNLVEMLRHDFLVMPRTSLDVVTAILGNSGGHRKLPLRGFTASAPAAAPSTVGVAKPTGTVAKPTGTIAEPTGATVTPKARAELVTSIAAEPVEVEEPEVATAQAPVETEEPAPRAPRRTSKAKAAAAPVAEEPAEETDMVFAPTAEQQETAEATIGEAGTEKEGEA